MRRFLPSSTCAQAIHDDDDDDDAWEKKRATYS